MKRILITLGLMSFLSPAFAIDQVHYFVPIQADKGVKVGVNASSANPVDGTVIWKNAADDNTVTIKSTGTTASYELILPNAAGGAGEALATDAAGQLYWSTISTMTSAEVRDTVGAMVENATHYNIVPDYDPATGLLHISVSSSVILDGQNATLNVVNVSSISSVGSVTAGSFAGGDANLGVITASSMTSAGSITAGSVVSGGTIHGNALVSDTSVTAGTLVTTGTVVIGGGAIVTGDVNLNRDQSIIFNTDTSGDSKISQESADDALKFYRNNVLYMQFE